MKISVVGTIPVNDKEAYMAMIDTFVNDHKVGRPVIMVAGPVETLSMIDKYAKGSGYDGVLFGNIIPLAILNANKVIFVWDGVNKEYAEAIELAKANKVPYITLRTK
jgi:hypothetical protein